MIIIINEALMSYKNFVVIAFITFEDIRTLAFDLKNNYRELRQQPHGPFSNGVCDIHREKFEVKRLKCY